MECWRTNGIVDDYSDQVRLSFNHAVNKTRKDIKIYFSTPNTKKRPPSVCYLQKLCNIFLALARVRVLLIFNNSLFSHHFLITTPKKGT